MSEPHILMCPPAHYGIEYEINPWMNQARQVDSELASRQWRDLKSALESAGARISEVEPVPGLPDMVFTANAALMRGEEAYLSRFRHPQRQGEEPRFAAWFESHGIRVHRLEPDEYFEGAGDALFCGDTLFAGYKIRSHAAAMQRVGGLLDVRVIPLELVDEHYYHLDTCFCPLNQDTAIYFPGAFDAYGRTALESATPHLIAVQEEEARSFACNAVVVGTTVVTNTGCPQLHRDLQSLGMTTVATPLSEFVKSGGSAKCLTLRLDGEEAAGWKHA